LSALVVAPSPVLWRDFGRFNFDRYRRRSKRAERAAQAVSLSLDTRKAAVWYRITRARACEHPEQGVERYRDGELVFCTCAGCGCRWKEAPLVIDT
jgi:hypothetical protein